MKTKVLSIAEVNQQHLIECPKVSFEFFMTHYCNQFLEKHAEVHVIVSDRFKFVFK